MRRRFVLSAVLAVVLLSSAGCGMFRAQVGFGFGLGAGIQVPAVVHTGFLAGVMGWAGLDYEYHRPPADSWERTINIFAHTNMYSRKFLLEEGDTYYQGHTCFTLLPILTGIPLDDPVRNSLAFEVEVQLLFLGFRFGFNPGHKKREAPAPKKKDVGDLLAEARQAGVKVSGEARGHFDRKEWEQAATKFGKAGMLDPYEPSYPFNKGLALMQLDRRKECEAAFTEALRRDKTLVMAHRFRGVIRHEEGNLDGALADYDAFLAKTTDDALIYAFRAKVHHAKKRYQPALDDYRAAYRLNPKDLDSLRRIPGMMVALGDVRGGRDTLEAELKKLPADHPQRPVLEEDLQMLNRILEQGGR